MSFKHDNDDYEISFTEPKASNVVFLSRYGNQNKDATGQINHNKRDKRIIKDYSPNTTKIVSASEERILTTRVGKGGNEMDRNEFVTQKELNHLEEKFDLKLEGIQTKIDAEFKVVNTKIDDLPIKFENMLLKQLDADKKEREKERKNDRRWLIGILVTLGLFAIKEVIFPLIQSLFIK